MLRIGASFAEVALRLASGSERDSEMAKKEVKMMDENCILKKIEEGLLFVWIV